VGAAAAVPVTGPFTLDGFTTDGRHLWLLAQGVAYALDPETLAVQRRVRVRGPDQGDVRGIVAAHGGVFVLADNGATLVRVDDATPRDVLRVLPSAPGSLRIPAALVARGDRVYALVPRTDRGRATRLAGYDAATGQPTRAVDLPSSLFAGAIAAS
jgi:hypothetical protein